MEQKCLFRMVDNSVVYSKYFKKKKPWRIIPGKIFDASKKSFVEIENMKEFLKNKTVGEEVSDRDLIDDLWQHRTHDRRTKFLSVPFQALADELEKRGYILTPESTWEKAL